MNLTEQQLAALEQLQDINLPEAITWWPLASTWWVLILSVTFIAIGLVWYFREQQKRNAYRREAKALLSQIMHSKESNVSINEQVLAINSLLKQVALTTYGRLNVAKLNDQAWLDFLKQNASFIKQPESLQDIFKLAYQKPHSHDSNPEQQQADQALLNLWQDYAEKWIKGHHQ